MHATLCKCTRRSMARIRGTVLLACLVLVCVQVSDAAGDQKPSEERTASDTPDSPYETQTAQCTITSGEIEASAQASISKTLVGVCGSEEMVEAFKTLELKMLEEMNNLRRMIRDPYFSPPPLRPSVFKTIKRVTTASNTSSNTALPQAVTERPEATTRSGVPKTTTPESKIVFPNESYEDEDYDEKEPGPGSGSVVQNSDLVKKMSSRNSTTGTRLSADEAIAPGTSPVIDFKPIDKPIENKLLTGGLRDYDVYRFNNTVISSGDAKVFKFFWKIEHFTKLLRAAAGKPADVPTFTSPVFVISGLNLRLHAGTTMKVDGEVLHVQLEQLSASDDALRKTPNNRVILTSGALYGQVETKKFFRHKIMILNQNKLFNDLISSDLNNTNEKFEAPLSALIAGPFLKDDKLLIQVIIFL